MLRSRLRLLVPAAAIAAVVVTPLALMTLGDDARAPTRANGDVATAVGKRFVRPQPTPRTHAHSGELGVRGMSERELRAFETAVIGPAHAREHALLRRSAARGRPPERDSTGAAAAAVGDPADVGRWSAPFSIPVMAVHAALLPTGKVLWFSYPVNPSVRHGGIGAASPNTAQAWLWDPGSGQHTRVDPPLWRDPADGQLKPANIWCAGQSVTSDGRVVVVGGNLAFSSGSADYKGLNKVYTFNPFNETWTEQPDMRHGRWYPTTVRLPDGRMPILSGLDESGVRPGNYNEDIEVFSPGPDLDGRGTIELAGTLGGSGKPPTGGLYPHLFSMPSGRMLVAGPFPGDTWFMNPPGSSSYTWQDAPNMPRDRLWGTAVLIPGGPGGSTRVMGLGGSAPPTVTSTTTDIAVPTTAVFDEANTSLGWRAAPSMNVGRGHHNTVLLPDGSMVTVGGGVGIRNGDQWAADEEQKQIELWDPATGNWTLGPAQAENRAYHSVAMLLPNGRVISAGDDVHGGIDRDTAEIYEPPYLFKGARPTISAAPATARTGTTFDVDTPDANVTKATLVAPAAVTHAVDMNQRSIALTVAQRTGGVRLTAPASPELAPPGYYMLFLVNDQGVPSVAKFVRLLPGGTLSSTDLAAGRPTSASSVEKAGLESGKAVDSNSATRWSSSFTDNQWWQVDLGSVRKISKVELNWEAAYASRYKLLTSTDGSTFTEAADVTIGGPGLKATTFTEHDARYVRVQGVTRATQWGISFWDARVFGPGDTEPPPPPPSAYANTILGTSGLTGYWRLGETSGTTAAPARGSVSGTYGARVLLGQPGLIAGDSNPAPVFQNLSSSWVRFGDVFDFDATRAFSAEAWIKPTTADTNGRRIFSKEWTDAAGKQGWYLLHTSKRVEFSRIRNNVWQNASRPALTPGTRYHVAITYDGARSSLYVDGALAGSAASAQALANGTVPFTVGARSDGGGSFIGTLDEPAVYDGVALTPAQVQAHFDAGK